MIELQLRPAEVVKDDLILHQGQWKRVDAKRALNEFRTEPGGEWQTLNELVYAVRRDGRTADALLDALTKGVAARAEPERMSVAELITFVTNFRALNVKIQLGERPSAWKADDAELLRADRERFRDLLNAEMRLRASERDALIREKEALQAEVDRLKAQTREAVDELNDGLDTAIAARRLLDEVLGKSA